jgi:pyrroline-5-carboxylate reductase
VTGLCGTQDPPSEIWVSPRNSEAASLLADRFPAVHIGSSNQAVLDNCDTAILAVRPQVALEAIRLLTFREDHRVISLIATLSSEVLAPLILPASSLTLAAPLPTVAFHRGPTAIFPPDARTAALFGKISVPVEVTRQSQFDSLFACTSEMASYFQLLEVIADFLSSKGIAHELAQQYVASFFSALGHTAQSRDDQNFADLVADHMTKGGINEQARSDLLRAGVFAAHSRCLNRILYRIQGHRKW